MAPHNIWLECALWVPLGKAAACRFQYGHHMEVQGKARPERARLWAAPPDGKPVELALVEDGDTLSAEFFPAVRGVYALLAEYDPGVWSVTADGRYLPGPAEEQAGEEVVRTIRYGHFAKRLVFVEQDTPWPGSFGREMEIVPLPPARAEQEILVQYRGRPLGGAKVHAVGRGRPGGRYGITGPGGKLEFGLPAGEWLLFARHESPGTDADGADLRVTGVVLALTRS